MAWQIEYTDEFEEWWLELDQATQDKIAFVVGLLEQNGVNLESQYSSGINGSRYRHMRELKVQCKGEPYRILYAFDPRRVAVLLLGGNKGGNDLWYEENILKADKLYEKLLEELSDEGLI
ncbi:MAG: type II toxin-antitoxin system RelE/ParE family toxin [Calothrix sp. SM1_7_51]|nr:type II toxin-antitoxin system RelE/ParE family toxin [Calothrix sp. SM1_7_51]